MVATILETGDLCMGCGACAAVCGVEAIKLRYNSNGYKPTIGPSCINCGKCIKVCPGISWTISEVDWSSPMGSIRRVLIGHVTDSIIKKNASSGGAVPAIILHAMDERQLDGAIVTRMSKNNPLKAEPFLALLKEDVLSATGSKYCPSPVALSIRDILRAPAGQYAFVGLPCHIRALRRFELMFPELRNKIAVRIGLLCHHTPLPEATDNIIRAAGERPDCVKGISYRAGPNKRSMRLSMIDGEDIIIRDYWGSGFGQLYEPYACTMCPDHTNEGADISVGDPLELLKSGAIDESLIIVRTDTGNRFISSAIMSGILAVKEIDLQRVEDSLKNKIIPRKKNIKARLVVARSLGRPTPNFALEPPKAPFQAYIRALAYYAQRSLMQRKSSRAFFLSLHPIKAIRKIEESER